ncbi:hypothetical protein [Microbacterium sp. 18062]|uniref:hypothetical protein n=1 Tax=Microbacterium sp. 18062 TaxID=2681410 RepID=UPI0013590037|nr:hypothetical protein [Microbacterium sp. 18062]
MLKNKDEIVSEAFGLWVSALFSNIAGFNPGMSFFEQKEEFFLLIGDLLEKGRVRFLVPNEFPSQGVDFWESSPKKIVEYLRSKFPRNAVSESDLSDYFYEIPPILWVDEEGRLHGS